MGMDIDQLLKLVHTGDLDPEEAKHQLEELLRTRGSEETGNARPTQPAVVDLGFAQVDTDRQRRTGFPEVIFGEGKSAEQLAMIFRKLMQHGDRVLATRVSMDKAEHVLADIPEAAYNQTARALTWEKAATDHSSSSYVAVVCAGTSDLPVAEEAAVTAEMLGCRVERITDVGVAGIHRLFARIEQIRGASAIVVVAGMEGALPSVVGGLVDKPLIAVPTSIGYGANFGGLSALLGMLNSCAAGITVVNIDNGFGAGYAAAVIARQSIGKTGDA